MERLTDYRYGFPGPRNRLLIGVTRHLPRGIRREEYSRRGYFDVWLPLLAPSAQLLAAYQKQQISFSRFAAKYRAEMRSPAVRHVLRLVAATAERMPVSIGCFCADASHCHRSLLKPLIEAAAKQLPIRAGKSEGFFSPACSMPEIDD
jgi:uncharacterized protein YeaO (DUF488 family)